MGEIRISEMPAAGSLTGVEEVPVVQSADTVRTTAQAIADLAGAPALPVSIGNGGSGETTRQAALDAFFGAVTKGMSWWGDNTNITGLVVGANGEVLTADSAELLGVKWAAPAGGMAIGGAVTGGTATRMLFLDTGPVLANSADLTYGAVAGRLTIGQGTNNGGLALLATNVFVTLGAGGVALDVLNAFPVYRFRAATGTAAGEFSDGGRTVSFCNGTDNITYSPGTPANWSAAPPTDLWLAVDRISAWIAANFPVPPPP